MLLAILMVVGQVPVNAFAVEEIEEIAEEVTEEVSEEIYEEEVYEEVYEVVEEVPEETEPVEETEETEAPQETEAAEETEATEATVAIDLAPVAEEKANAEVETPAAEPVTVEALKGEGTEESPYLISSLEELIFFRDHVNAGETTYNAPGVYVALDADIDMAAMDWSINIGDDCNATFDGIFDGKDHKISNLNSVETAAKSDGYVCTGLFGAIYGTAVVKNLTIENVTIDTGDYVGNNAGAVVGFAYKCKGSVENVTVTGDININAAGITGTGVIVGYDYYGKLSVKNCSVEGNPGSRVQGASYVGGVIGYASSNSDISGNSVNGLSVQGKAAVGGVAGIQLGTGKTTDNTVKNVALNVSHENWQNSAGIAVGTMDGGTIEVSGTEYSNVTIKGQKTDVMVGSVMVDKPTTPVAAVEARIGNVYYPTLKAAVEAVEDGGTINLVADCIITEATRTHNSGTWYDGIYYVGDKSFTIDLGGFTIGQDGSVNDYLLNFKNEGTKANTITLTNGTIDAGTSAYCAICTSTASTQQITIDLEGVEVVNKNSYGSTIKVRGGAVLNVKDGTTITGKDSYLAIECIAATVNIYDGAEIYMNGKSSDNGCMVGVGYGGTVNVHGGYGEGAKGGFIAMTSGGTINVKGGEWIANTDGTVGDNSNLYVLTSQNNSYESGYAGASVINVTGGTFRGGMDAWVLHADRNEVAELNISGGNFNAKPSSYVEKGYEAEQDEDSIWTVSKMEYAEVGGEIYTSLQAAIDAAEDGDTVTVLKDQKLKTSIVVDKEITLDLNGKTIVGVPTEAAAYAVITNKGDLTITGDGTIKCDHDLAGSTGYAVNTIVNSGKLTIDGATIENVSTASTQIGYAIDNNSTSYDAILVIENGEIKVSGSYYYDGIRLFCNSMNAENSVTVNGGSVSSIWMQNPSDGTEKDAKDVKGNVTVTGGSVGALYLEPSSGFTASITGGNLGSVSYFSQSEGRNLVNFITGGTFEEKTDVVMLDTEKKFAENEDGTWSVVDKVYPALIGDQKFETLEDAFAAAVEGDTINLVADAAPVLKSQKAITKAAVIDLGGNILTLSEDDLYFGTTTFQNGTIVVAPSVKSSTAVFWMFANQSLVFDNVDIIATGVSGTYLIGIYDGTGTEIQLVDSSIVIDNEELVKLTAVICDNGNGNSVVIENCDIDVTNLDGRFYLGGKNGTITVTDSDIDLNGVKEGFYVRAGQTLSILGSSTVDIALNTNEGRYGINLIDLTSKYIVDESAVVNATIYKVIPAAVINGAQYLTLAEALAAAEDGDTIVIQKDYALEAPVVVNKKITLDLNGKTVSYTSTVAGESLLVNKGDLTIDGDGKLVMTYEGTPDSSYGKGNYTITNGGKLTVESGIIENATAKMSHAFYTIDNNSAGFASAELIVNGGEVINNNNHAIRQFAGGPNSVTINGGEVSGTRAVWMQAAGSDTKAAPEISLTVTGGTLSTINEPTYQLAVYSYSYGNKLDNVAITIEGGTINGHIALCGGSSPNTSETFTMTAGQMNGGVYTYANEGVYEDRLNISGGTFSAEGVEYTDPAALAEHKTFDENGNVVDKHIAKIGDIGYISFKDALEAVEDGQTITIADYEGTELKTEIEFDKDITFTITGYAPNYELPVITFQNATVNIQDATILIPELDARKNATINVIDSTLYAAGGNSIVKSYYNGAINISGDSTVYTMQVTTMGYINLSDNAKLIATWQTNVYGNGLVNVKDNATFNTAAMQLTGQDYSGRDNTDADRVGKAAEVVVDGATLIVGKAFSSSGADYSYHSSYGINIGTKEDKSAVLNIKNGANVEFWMANGQTANIGADGIVNVDGSAFSVACRGEGDVTLNNKGKLAVQGNSALSIPKLSGTAVFVTDDATLTDTVIGGAVYAGYGANKTDSLTLNIAGTFKATGLYVGNKYEHYTNGEVHTLNITEGAEVELSSLYVRPTCVAEINKATVVTGDLLVRGSLTVDGSTMSHAFNGGTGHWTVYEDDDATKTATLVLKDSVISTNYLVVGSNSNSNTAADSNANVTVEGGSLTLNKLYVQGAENFQNNSFELKNAELSSGSIYVHDYAAVEVDKDSSVTSKTITGNGKLIIDVTGMEPGVYANIDADASNYTGEIETVGNYRIRAEIIDGKITLVAVTVAMIGDNAYATLADAIEAAAEGDTIVLVYDFDDGDVIVNKAVTLDLNGHELTANINATATASVKDTVGTGKVVGDLSGKLAISGGTFTDVVEPGFCAEGFVPTKLANGNYSVIDAATVVAKIGDMNYAALSIAADRAEKGETIVLVQDNAPASNVDITKELTIDLNGKTLVVNNPIDVSANLKVTNGTVTAADGVACIYNLTKGTLTIADGTYETAGNVINGNGGTAKVTGGIFHVKAPFTGKNINVTGGKFQTQVAATYLDSKHACVKDGSYYNVVKAAASVNGTNYASLTAAVAAAKKAKAAEIKLMADCDETVTVDFCVTITRNGYDAKIKVTTSYKLTTTTKAYTVAYAAPTVSEGNVASSGKPKISWNALSYAAKYEIQRATSEKGTYKTIATVTATSYVDSSAKAGTTYYYKVRGVDANGPYSEVINRTCDLAQPVAKAANVAASGKIKLTWAEVTDAEAYEVYRSTSENGTYTMLKETTGTSYTDTSAKAGTTYYYKVKALHAKSAADSAYSAVVSCRCDLARPVVETSNTASTGKVKLSWEAISGAKSYTVFRAASEDGEYEEMTTTENTSYTDSSAAVGKTYYYRVRANHSNSSYNSAKSTVVSDARKLERPDVEAKNTASSGKVKITWEAIDGAKNYTVYRASSKNGVYGKLGTTSSTSYTDSDGILGVTYYYKVQANHSKSSLNSAQSTAVSGSRNLARPDVSVKLVKGDPKLSWKAISAISKYNIYRATSEDGEYKKIGESQGVSYTDTTAKAGKTYYYKVRAMRTDANSAYSTVVSIKAK